MRRQICVAVITFVVSVILLSVLAFAGCDASGGVGGQAIVIKDVTVAEGGRFEVKVDIDDGGTSLASRNPTKATSQPATRPEN